MFRFLSFLSDFGLQDEWVGACKGVVYSLMPTATIIDISHEIPSYNVRKGAITLASAIQALPVGVHLAVVDPGVGSARRALILQAARGDYLVGPDNGLLPAAAAKLGGITRAVEITNEQYFRQPVCPTFQARDLFAPVAAHLLRGVEISNFGSELALHQLEPAPWLPPVRKGDLVALEVIDIDGFGTVRFNLPKEQAVEFKLSYGQKYRLKIGRVLVDAPFVKTFSEVSPGQPLFLFDSSDWFCLAVNMGSAAEKYNLSLSDKVQLLLGV
jgi:hypothetical protein